MTTELVLLLGIYAFLLLGAFLGDLGPIETFKKSAPRLGARIERNISVGDGFRSSKDGSPLNWVKPDIKEQ
ncbi:MAG TPA: hypothetical protein PKC28_06950 [Bdellovibrionales bacterium]|nr:hypothetical protein [Bdellovibrionales bacterium]